MRDAGDWLPFLPDGWNKGRLRWQADVYSGGTPSRDVAGYWADGTIPWLASGAVNQWEITEPSEFITERALRESSAQWVPVGAVVMGLAGQGKTKGMVARTAIRATCNQSMCALVPNPATLDHRFLHFWLSVNHSNIRNLAGGDKRDGLNHEHVRSIVVPLPPLEEQRRIADFLDRETGEIDAMDAELDHLIETLQERRRETISHILSSFPRGRLRFVLSLAQTGPFGTQLAASEYVTGGIPLINPTHITPQGIYPEEGVGVTVSKAKELSRHQLLPGDIVLGRKGEVDKAALVPTGLGPALCGSDAMLLRADTVRCLPEFLWWFFQSPDCHQQLELLSVGSTVTGLNQTAINSLWMPAPTLDEQRRIAAELDEQTARIDEMIADANRLKTLLAERRSTLITEVVTGVKEVPA